MDSFIAHELQLEWISTQLKLNEPANLVVQRIMTYLHQNNPQYTWVGIYLLDGKTLKVGPYAGPETNHTEIPVGQGVCGTAVATGNNQIIDDVASHENYLACNLETRSEMVVLIRNKANSIIGQIDIDSARLAHFSAAEQKFVLEVAQLLSPLVSDLTNIC